MRLSSILACCALALASLPATAQPDPNAQVILLRTDCSGLTNCFDSLDAANDWTWNTRNPSAAAPLLWDVGPGTFDGYFKCRSAGHVTVRGSGRDTTTFINTGMFKNPVDIGNCTRIGFQDIRLVGEAYAVYWNQGGDSTWTNVDIVGAGPREPTTPYAVGWYEDNCSTTNRAVHYFFGSRVEVSGTSFGGLVDLYSAFDTCSEVWFYGGEVKMLIDAKNVGPNSAVLVKDNGDFRAFGTAIRATMLKKNASGPVGVTTRTPGSSTCTAGSSA